MIRGLRLPAPEDFRVYLIYSVIIDVVFILVYGGNNWLSAQREQVFKFYWDWELGIPFLPGFIWIYISMFVLFLFPLFQLQGSELPRLGKQLLLGTFVSGMIFLLFPSGLGFQRIGDSGALGGIFSFVYALDFPYNQLPSLHIVFSGLIIASMIEVATIALRIFYVLWLLALLASVVLVHQHHIADVITAFMVIWISRYFFKPEIPGSD